jgi:hypothetical protein
MGDTKRIKIICSVIHVTDLGPIPGRIMIIKNTAQVP